MFAHVVDVSRPGYMLLCAGVLVCSSRGKHHGKQLTTGGMCWQVGTHASKHIACMIVAVYSWGSEWYVHSCMIQVFSPLLKKCFLQNLKVTETHGNSRKVTFVRFRAFSCVFIFGLNKI